MVNISKAIAVIMLGFVSLMSSLLPSEALAAEDLVKKFVGNNGCEYFTPGKNYDGSDLTYPEGVQKNDGTTLPAGSVIAAGDNIKRPGLTYVMVSCFESILGHVTAVNLSVLSSNLQGLIATLLLLYLMLFGVKVTLTGFTNIKSEIMVVLFTVGLVYYFAVEVGISDYLAIWRGFMEAMVNLMAVNVDAGAGLCTTYTNVWLRLDCTVLQLLGAYDIVENTRDAGGNLATPVSILQLIETDWSRVGFALFKVTGAAFGSNVLSILVMFFTFMLVLALMLAITQAMFVYVISLMAITFAGFIAPLMIPMILFEKTSSMFDKWLRLFFAYLIQPVVVVGFLAFTINVFIYIFDRDCPAGTTSDLMNEAGGTYTARCGLVGMYSNMKTAGKKTDKADVVKVSSKIEESAAGQESACAAGSNESADCKAAQSETFVFSLVESENLEWVIRLFREILLIYVLLAVMHGFLSRVLADAGVLVGSQAINISGKVSAYNRSMLAIQRLAAKSGK